MSLKDEILARPELAAAVAARDLDAIAAGASVGRTKAIHIPVEDIQAALMATGEWWQIKGAAAQGLPAAVMVVDVASARVGAIDFALPLVLQQFHALVDAGALSQATLDAMQTLAVQPDPVDRMQVEAALYNPDGSLK
jgi:hypothetical protein